MRTTRILLGLSVALLLASGGFAQCPVIGVTPSSLANAAAGQSYGPVGFTASPPESYTFTASGLPAGMTFLGGSLVGTPTVIGEFVLRIVATDPNGCLATHVLPLTVDCPTITVTPPTLPDGLEGMVYPGQTLAGSGGIGAYTFAVTSGALPPGLTLTGDTIAGTPTTAAGSPFAFTVTATDDNGCTGLQAYTVTIGTCPTIAVTNPPVVDGTAGSPYTTAAFTETGATTPSFTIASGTLPAGLTLDASTGIISGTPTETGTFDVTVTATETAGATTGCSGTGPTYSFQICPVITVTNPPRADGTSGSPYTTAAFTATGATTPSFTIASGTLPAGLTLDAATGIISGTPTEAGAFSVTVRATETAAGGTNGCSGVGATYTFQICPVITVGRTGGGSFPDPLYQAAYAGQGFAAAGGTGPYTFAVTSGALPTGLSLAADGAISGTPATTGVFGFTVTATDTAGSPPCTGSQAFSLTARPNTVGESYNGGVGNTQYVIAGYLPFPATPAVSHATAVLANDLYPGPLTGLAVTTPAAHGFVAINADGTFLYTPGAGDTASTDAFVYTLTDANGITNTATVTINLAGMVWYVDNTIGSTGDGRSHSPFKVLSDAQGPGAFKPQTGQVIYVHAGSGSTTGSLNLLANQMLWGNGVAFGIGGLSLPAGTRPTLTGAVALASDVALKGLTFNPAGSALTSSGIAGTSTIDQCDVAATSNATAVSLATGTGTIAFTSTPIGKTAGSGTGLSIASKTGGTVSLDAASPITVTSGVATGISLTSNTGATISFAGTLTLNTTTSPAFAATGGGTVTSTATGSTLSSSATALNVTSTTIGAAGLTFLRIDSVGGTAPGIVLNGSGPGFLLVTGDGGGANNGSGGTISGKTGASESTGTPGVRLNNAANVRLKYMNITGNNHSGIYGGFVSSDGSVISGGVNGFELDHCNITGNGDQGVSNPDEAGVDIYNLTGTASAGSNPTSITNTTISNNEEFELQITSTTGTLADFRMTDDTISSDGATGVHGNLVNFLGLSSASMTLNLSGGSYTGAAPNTATGVHCDTGGGSVTCNIANASFTNNNVGINVSAALAGNLTFDVHDNPLVTGNRSHGLNLFVAANVTGSVNGRFRNNVVGTLGVTGSGSSLGYGIRVQNEGVGTASPTNVLISGNTIQEMSQFAGINVNQGIAGQPTSRTTNATITGNTITNVNNSRAIVVQQNNSTSGTSAGATCVDISGNDMSGIAGQVGDGTKIRLRVLTANGGLFNVRQRAATGAADPLELDDANSVGAHVTTAAQISASGTFGYNAGACPTP